MRNQNLRKETRHGTISGYQRHKFRCGACKQAKKEYEKKRVLLKTPEIVGPKPINHGTPAAYSYHGCRCDVCRAFARGYQKGFKLRNADLQEEIMKLAKLSHDELLDPLKEKEREHGTAESYSFGCKCDLCLTKGRNEYLMEIAA